jgi:DNA polymerase-3 subunit delta'
MSKELSIDTMPWLHGAREQLIAALGSGRLHHAWCLSGPEGIGKTQLARYFAQTVLCQHAVGAIPCGACSSCQHFFRGTHGDFLCLSVADDKKAISIDQIRQAIGFVHKTPGYGGYKALVITSADTMTVNAANALLKVLEEPSGETIIILVAEGVGGLPATIRSRCQRLTLGAPNAAQARQFLLDQGISDEYIDVALKLAQNAPLTALHAIQEGDMTSWIAMSRTVEQLLAGAVHASEARKILSKAPLDSLVVMMRAALTEHIKSSCECAQTPTRRQSLGEQLDVYREIDTLYTLLKRGANPNADIFRRRLFDLFGTVAQ